MNSHKSHSLVLLPFRGPFPRWLACLQPASQPLPRFYYWYNRTWLSQGKSTCPILFLTLPVISHNFSSGPGLSLPALLSPPHLPWHLPAFPIGVTHLLGYVERTEVSCPLWVSMSYLFSSSNISLFCIFFFLSPFSYWLSCQMNKHSIAGQSRV